MAQRVQAVPNPRYQTAPLETTGATIVSFRRVMVPPFVQAVFKGVQDYSGTVYNYITFQIADNESFMDNKCLFLIFDLTVFGPNAKDNSAASGTPRTYGRDLDLVFDQSSSALIAQLTIGSPQGLKFEELMSYNLYGNIIALHTQPRQNKESHLLNWTEWSKDIGKDYGLQHFTDQQWCQPCRIKVGEKTRMAMRLDFSDFMQNIDLFPLFLIRNGLQFIFYLENAYKVFYSPHGSLRSRDIVLQSTLPCATNVEIAPPYYVGPGAYYLNSSNVATASGLDNVNTIGTSATYFSPNFALASNYSGSAALVPTFNTLWLPANLANRIISSVDGATDVNQGVLIPISMYEMNQIVWSGFIKVDNFGISLSSTVTNSVTSSSYLSTVATVLDQFNNANLGNVNGTYTTEFVFTAGSAYTEASLNSAEITSQGFVPQLDVDKTPNANWVTGSSAPYATIGLSRYATAGTNLTPSNRGIMVGFPMFSFHDNQYVPYIAYAPLTDTTATLADAWTNVALRGGKCIIHMGDAVNVTFNAANAGVATLATAGTGAAPNAVTVSGGASGCIFDVVNPAQNGAASVLSLWNLSAPQRTIRYQMENPQLLLDLIKPGAEEFMQWQQAFSSPSGIPIKFKKPIYRKLNFQAQTSGLLQIQIPINVRSMTGIIFVIQDPSLDIAPNDLLNSLMLANLSTFQNRRLTEQYVQIGGQQYPVYMYQMRPDGSALPYWEAHILEAEKFFAVAGTSSFNSVLSRPMIKKTRNMLAGGYLGATAPLNQGNLGRNQRCTYTDSSGTVYSMNVAKDWVRPFTTGVDSSQSASIALNLYFKDPTNASNVSTAFGTGVQAGNIAGGRSFNVHLFAMCDAVATLQESANLVRY